MKIREVDLESEDIIHGAQGYIEPIRDTHRPVHFHRPENRECDERGKAHEAKFKAFVELLMKTGGLPWALRIRHASRNEDERHAIDFKIDAVDSRGCNRPNITILIQVKSSWMGARLFEDEEHEERIFVIVVNEATTPEMVQRMLQMAYSHESRAKKRGTRFA